MPSYASAATSPTDYVGEYDPHGAIARAAREIGGLIDADMAAVADTFFSTYMRETALKDRLPRNAVDRIESEARIYVEQKLLHFQDARWTRSAADCVRHARKHGVPVRAVLIAVGAANEKIMDFIWERCAQDDDDARQRRLLHAVLHMSMLDAGFMSKILSNDEAESQRMERQRFGTMFEQRIVGEIDGASKLGESLREQAKDASAATRGMLGKASEVAAAAEQSALAMREAARTSAGLIRAIEDARTEVESSAAVARRASAQSGDAVTMSATLSEHAKSIESILGLIRDIAGQTNLLALNAAIEAARAGESGRGFAVVADEVRALAHRTQQSTLEIDQMVTAMRTGSNDALTSMQSSTQRATETLTLAEGAGGALSQITDSIDQIHQRNLVIASAAEEQAQVAKEVDRNIVNIRDLSAQSSSGAGQINGASQELARLAVALNEAVARFQL